MPSYIGIYQAQMHCFRSIKGTYQVTMFRALMQLVRAACTLQKVPQNEGGRGAACLGYYSFGGKSVPALLLLSWELSYKATESAGG